DHDSISMRALESARLQRAGRRILRRRTFLKCRTTRSANNLAKVRFGRRPKPVRCKRALPRICRPTSTETPIIPERSGGLFGRDDDEGLFSRDINGQLVRLDAPTQGDSQKQVTLQIDGQSIT